MDYRERASAYGHIPGTFNKREGAPKDREILAMRVLDRAVGAARRLRTRSVDRVHRSVYAYASVSTRAPQCLPNALVKSA